MTVIGAVKKSKMVRDFTTGIVFKYSTATTPSPFLQLTLFYATCVCRCVQPYYKDGPEGEESIEQGQNYLFPNPGYPREKEVRIVSNAPLIYFFFLSTSFFINTLLSTTVLL